MLLIAVAVSTDRLSSPYSNTLLAHTHKDPVLPVVNDRFYSEGSNFSSLCRETIQTSGLVKALIIATLTKQEQVQMYMAVLF